MERGLLRNLLSGMASGRNQERRTPARGVIGRSWQGAMAIVRLNEIVAYRLAQEVLRPIGGFGEATGTMYLVPVAGPMFGIDLTTF